MESFKEKMTASLNAAKQRVEEKVVSSGLSEGVTKLKDNASKLASEKKVALESMISQLPARGAPTAPARAGDEVGSEPTSSDGEPATEKERLVGSDSQARPLQRGLSSLGDLGESLSQLGRAGQAKVANSLERAKIAGQQGVGAVGVMGTSGVEKLRTASSSGVEKLRTASSSGVEKLRTASAEAKGRCGEALDAASAMSGVSLPGGGSGRGPMEDEGLVRVCKCCPPLSFKQRVLGAFICLAIGALLSLGSLLSLAKLLLGNPIPFAFKYTLGNLLSLGATAFLVGPTRQCQGMIHPSRRLASAAYFATLAGTLISIFVLHSGLLSLVFILLQFMALSWYLLSYIPYGQTAAKSIGRRVLRRTGLLSKSSSGLHSSAPLPPV